eukprot:6476237-Amphidinium_carterae.2
MVPTPPTFKNTMKKNDCSLQELGSVMGWLMSKHPSQGEEFLHNWQESVVRPLQEASDTSNGFAGRLKDAEHGMKDPSS